jgi:hypothetical protein
LLADTLTRTGTDGELVHFGGGVKKLLTLSWPKDLDDILALRGFSEGLRGAVYKSTLSEKLKLPAQNSVKSALLLSMSLALIVRGERVEGEPLDEYGPPPPENSAPFNWGFVAE